MENNMRLKKTTSINGYNIDIEQKKRKKEFEDKMNGILLLRDKIENDVENIYSREEIKGLLEAVNTKKGETEDKEYVDGIIEWNYD